MSHRRKSMVAFLFACVAACNGGVPLSAAQSDVTCGPVLKENFLRCVGTLIDAARTTKPNYLPEQLRGLLESLAETEGYGGTSGDLEKLKSWSSELKDSDPISNRQTIAVLDNAIASHKDEIRAAISTRSAAIEALDVRGLGLGVNIQSIFVRRKLSFLESDKAKFYDRGPFEAVRRTLLANSIEESYFLDKSSGVRDEGKLRKEIQVIRELQALYENPPMYLPIQQLQLQRNSNLFWRASILFALGEEKDKVEFTEVMRKLASDNSKLGLMSNSPGHIYSYRVFNLPYEVRALSRNTRGDPVVAVDDPGVLNRFYNPAQLALVACAQLDGAGSDEGIKNFIKAVTDLIFYDYYVIAASAQNADKLQQFDEDLQNVIRSDKFSNQLETLMKAIAAAGRGFSDTVAKGAKVCGVEDSVRDDIYSPFRFSSTIERHTEIDKNIITGHLIFGGRLNATQARAVAEFIKKLFELPEIRVSLEKRGIEPTVFVARMQIDQ